MVAASRVLFVTAIEKRIEELARALAAGRRPSHDDARRLWRDLGTLPRTSGLIPSWKFAELDAAAQEIVRQALPPERQSPGRQANAPVPAQRAVHLGVSPTPAAEPVGLEARFDELRRRIDSLHDAIEAGRRPARRLIDELQADLETHRRAADGAEIRQMIDDLRGFRRRMIATSSRPGSPGLTSSRRGRGFWGAPLGEVARSRRGARSARGRAFSGPTTGELPPERARLAEESHRLRERADRFAAAVPQGRTLPLQETDRLFLHFKALRPNVDPETRALNDATVRLLADAVLAVRHQRSLRP